MWRPKKVPATKCCETGPMARETENMCFWSRTNLLITSVLLLTSEMRKSLVNFARSLTTTCCRQKNMKLDLPLGTQQKKISTSGNEKDTRKIGNKTATTTRRNWFDPDFLWFFSFSYPHQVFFSQRLKFRVATTTTHTTATRHSKEVFTKYHKNFSKSTTLMGRFCFVLTALSMREEKQ